MAASALGPGRDADTDEAWRAALDHSAGCRSCREPTEECGTGRALLRAYRQAQCESRRAGGVS